jgi:DNA-binding response OmpR family regulator
MNKQVVVVEDNADILDLIRVILTDEGFDVVGFDHIVPTHKILAQSPLVILLDVRLQDGNGGTLCRNIKSDPESRHIPVVLISALSNIEEMALECRADGFLAKPFDIADLVNLVKRYN